jgi:hypothetical protein
MVKIKLSILARLAFSDSPCHHVRSNSTMATNLVQEEGVPTSPVREEEGDDDETPRLVFPLARYMRFFDMAEKTSIFFAMLFTLESTRHTHSSFILYLIGGSLNGVALDYLEEKLGIWRGSSVQFVLYLVVSVAVSYCLLECVSGSG